MSYEWIKEVDWENHLPGELKEIAELIGIDNLLKLLERFGKTQVYFPTNFIPKLKRIYIRNNYETGRVKELCRKLDASQSFVFDAIASQRDDNQIMMFEKE